MIQVKCRVRGVIKKDEQLFLVQHVGYSTWCLPGGGIDSGEGLEQALKREIMEELGVEAQVGKLLVVHQFKENDVYQGPEFFFEIINVHDFEHLDITQTTHGQAEIVKAEFRDPMKTENLRPAFLDKLIDQKDILVVLE
jgi:8-oxo-dGTP pyrophosphatase MutT (NUDIX family)